MSSTTPCPEWRPDWSIYVVTDPDLCGPRGVTATVQAALDGGATAIQVRAKHLDGGPFLRQVLEVAQAAAGRATVIVNDRVDVFLAARHALQGSDAAVHGIHIGQSDLPVEQARALIGPDALLGLSAGTPEEVAHAEQIGHLPDTRIDVLGIGPLRTTPTKVDAGLGLGLNRVAALARATSIPAVTIGGVGAEDMADIRAAGLAGAAVVSCVMAANDPEAATRTLVRAWSEPSSHPSSHSSHGKAC